VVGASLFTGLSDVLIRTTDYWRAVLGAVILLLVLAFPQGVAGGILGLADRWRRSAVGDRAKPTRAQG
jgi:branched-chain amino acid transport system permease protein